MDEAGQTFEADPRRCVCAAWARAVGQEGHHGQCRWLVAGEACVGLTPAQTLERLGPPRPTIPLSPR